MRSLPGPEVLIRLTIGCSFALAVGFAAGCDGDPDVYVAPPKTGVGFGDGLTKCGPDKACEDGLECVDEVCTPITASPDVMQPDDLGSGDDAVFEDLAMADDPGMTPDPGTLPDPGGPDDLGTVDTGPEDTGPVDAGLQDTGPPPDDECTSPGTSSGCDSFTKACRVNQEAGSALMCIESTIYKTLTSRCLGHHECDVLYGCHFGVCTVYCELQFGSATCANASPQGVVWTCKDIGHPFWGACGP